ncbi:MAG TPA: hypothetical protein PL033_01875 [Candidatus Brocadiia bacterium]|nr:hypothetical protein [Candidatus Brocadiia bacterium]
MKADISKWCIVLVGRWNTSILSPQWLGKNILKNENVNILYPFVGDGPTIFDSGTFKIAVSSSRVQFYPERDQKDSLLQTEEAACNLLELLPHTPLKAFGENFWFNIQEPPDRFSKLFNLTDEEDADKIGTSTRIMITRSLALSECVVNAQFVYNLQDEGDPRYTIELNYHYPLKAEIECPGLEAARLLKDTIIKNREHAPTFLKNVYDLDLEQS